MGTKTLLLKNINPHLNHDVIQHMAQDLSLPADKAEEAIKTILPSLLMALTHHGPATVDLINKQQTPAGLMKEVFGNELTNFSTKLQPFTDMGLYAIINMMEGLLPYVVQGFREVLNQKHLKGSELKTWLADETEGLAEEVPSDISNHFGFGTANTEFGEMSRRGTGLKDLTDYPKH